MLLLDRADLVVFHVLRGLHWTAWIAREQADLRHLEARDITTCMPITGQASTARLDEDTDGRLV
jgi:hypothetical protein